MYVYIYTFIYIYIYIGLCVYLCVCMCIYVAFRMYVYVYIRLYINKCVCVCVCVYIEMTNFFLRRKPHIINLTSVIPKMCNSDNKIYHKPLRSDSAISNHTASVITQLSCPSWSLDNGL